MKTTGYSIKESIKRWEAKSLQATAQFAHNLYAFKGEQKTSPETTMQSFEQAQTAIASLKAGLARYSQSVPVSVNGKTMTLQEAVNLVPCAENQVKLWGQAAGISTGNGNGRRRHGGRSTQGVSFRTPKTSRQVQSTNGNKEYADRTISTEQAAQKQAEAARFSASLHEAISIANAMQVEVDNLSPSLFQ